MSKPSRPSAATRHSKTASPWLRGDSLIGLTPIRKMLVSVVSVGLLATGSLVLWYGWPWSEGHTAEHVINMAWWGMGSLAGMWLLLALLAALLYRQLLPLQREIAAVNLHAQNLQDGSFNTAANQQHIKLLAPLAHQLQQMSQQLRLQRSSLYQRELLLDTLVQANPGVLILTDASERILLTNPPAKQLLNHGRDITGSALLPLLETLPELATAIHAKHTGIIRFAGQQTAVWHLAISQFQLHNQQHNLYVLKPLSREIAREELNAWKTLLRVISHELNNTLAPLSSIAYSGQVLANRQEQPELAVMFNTISERCVALNQFLQSYVHFARLPAPTMAVVNWVQLINQLQDQYDFEFIGHLPVHRWRADQNQLSQLLLNLLKNAHESGSAVEHIYLTFHETPSHLWFELCDQGGGMNESVLQQAMTPFYTTKSGGSGIGLTLCRDIIQAHGGELYLQNHCGGLKVRFNLPVL